MLNRTSNPKNNESLLEIKKAVYSIIPQSVDHNIKSLINYLNETFDYQPRDLRKKKCWLNVLFYLYSEFSGLRQECLKTENIEKRGELFFSRKRLTENPVILIESIKPFVIA